MRRAIIILFALLFSFAECPAQELSPRCRAVLDTLVAQFDSLDVYEVRMLSRLQTKKEQCRDLKGRELMDAWMDIAEDYHYFNSDSSIIYLEKARRLAEAEGDSLIAVRSGIRVAKMLAILGYYVESKDRLDAISPRSIPPSILYEYYETLEHLYYELFHIDGSRLEFKEKYRAKYYSYADSVILYAPQNSEFGLRSREKKALKDGDCQGAMQCNIRREGLYPKGSIAESFVLYERSIIYGDMGGHREDALYCLLRSASIDLRNANRDVGAFNIIVSRYGDLIDVKALTKFSEYSHFSMTSFRSRTRRLIGSDAIIATDKVLRHQLEEQKSQLSLALVLLSILAVLLVVAVTYAALLIRRGKTLNRRLEQSNRISNTYLAGFFSLYSSYIDRLLSFRGKINTNLRRGNVNYVIELTNPSRDITNEELRHMYSNFDSAFLDIFPTFVEDFNSFLKPECRIALKQDEKLNTELRIFAMIKLGVSDSAKISELLHYSIKTVYNKRSSVNQKLAAPKTKFEKFLRNEDRKP